MLTVAKKPDLPQKILRINTYLMQIAPIIMIAIALNGDLS